MLALALNSNSKRETLPLTETFRIQVLLLPAATKLGQGNIFTGLCLSTGGGGRSASVHAGIYPLGADCPGSRPHPRDQTPPPGPDPTPGTRPHLRDQTPRDQTPQEQTPPGAHPPRTRPPGPEMDDPPDQTRPPVKQTPAYGQRAAGTHPTGMHSCGFCEEFQVSLFGSTFRGFLINLKKIVTISGCYDKISTLNDTED